MTVEIIFGLLALGSCTGFLAGLLGIGGGMIMTPFLAAIFSHIGMGSESLVHAAIATSLSTIMFTSLSSAASHNRRGAVVWPLVWTVAPGILAGGVAGARISSMMPTVLISILFAVFIGFSAAKMFFDVRARASRGLPGAAGRFAAGVVIGLVSSFVGAGGGFISVPLMVMCGVRMHHAVGTSAAFGFPIAVAGTIGYVISGLSAPGLPGWPETLGYVYLPALFTLALASTCFAPLGAKAAHSINTGPLKRIFACNLMILAAYMLYRAVTGW